MENLCQFTNLTCLPEFQQGRFTGENSFTSNSLKLPGDRRERARMTKPPAGMRCEKNRKLNRKPDVQCGQKGITVAHFRNLRLPGAQLSAREAPTLLEASSELKGNRRQNGFPLE